MKIEDKMPTAVFDQPKSLEHYESRAKIMKALAHPSRLMMVDALSYGEKCVCELTELVGHDISTVSKHLNLLKKAGVVVDEKRGKQVFYRLKVPCILNFFHCVESVVAANRK
ncbi:MAG: ArsR/SmtB family transcription factor [Desulfovibrio sp.]|uniref:ArsR/SmtB family transcription factor n=1 Tax=Desulfovibrio sp. 7SRBS1 TaxID=3378064 RepID=UPI003B3DC3A6